MLDRILLIFEKMFAILDGAFMIPDRILVFGIGIL